MTRAELIRENGRVFRPIAANNLPTQMPAYVEAEEFRVSKRGQVLAIGKRRWWLVEHGTCLATAPLT